MRTVEVLPPSRSDEATWVFLSAAFVCLVVIYILGFQLQQSPGGTSGQGAARALLPFQVLFRDLPSAEQRTFREMQEGLAEALQTRGSGGDWPSAESLAANNIPPFAHNVLDKSGLSWTQHRSGLIVEYLGVPTPGTGAPAFLILIQEPEPIGGERASPAVRDEEHQVLPDGTLLHVTYWKHADGAVPRALAPQPELRGWSQIRVKSPLEELEGS
jgi:uncharacterized protein DUF6162